MENLKIYSSVTRKSNDEPLGFSVSSYVLAQKGHKIYNWILFGKTERNVYPEVVLNSGFFYVTNHEVEDKYSNKID